MSLSSKCGNRVVYELDNSATHLHTSEISNETIPLKQSVVRSQLWGNRMDSQNSIVKIGTKCNLVPLILVTEDDSDNQLLLEKTIEMFGWNSIITDNALDTIYLAKKEQPDIVLIDIVLPEISGLQIASILKTHPTTNYIPLIAVTGLVRDTEKILISRAGFNDCIHKPYMLDSLYHKIAHNLNYSLLTHRHKNQIIG